MKIYLNIEAESPEEVRSVLTNLLGSTSEASFAAGFEAGSGYPNASVMAADEGTSTSVVSDLSAPAPDTAPQRERGKPSGTRARRTKEEIAEDEAADAADAAAKSAGEETGAEVADRQISTSPEDRVDAEQDAADEAAETAANKEASGKALTHDDFRGVMATYVQKFGMDAAQAEGPQIISMMFGAGKRKTTDIPETDKALSAAMDTVNKIIGLREANPDFKDFEEVLDLFKKQAGF